MPEYMIEAHTHGIVVYYVEAKDEKEAKKKLEKNPSEYDSEIIEEPYIESYGQIKENK